MRARRVATAVSGACAAATLLLTTACGADGSGEPLPGTHGGGKSGSAPAREVRRAFEPPQTFRAPGPALPEESSFTQRGGLWDGKVVGALPVTLHEHLAYVAVSDSLQALDTGTGEELSTVRPRRKALYDAKRSGGN